MSVVNSDIAIEYVLKNEGDKFTNDPLDGGGATKFGLTLGFIQSSLGEFSIDQLKNLERKDAKSIYRMFIWEKSKCKEIDSTFFSFSKSQEIANYIFDCIVNHGEENAAKIIQRSLIAIRKDEQIVDDGVFGSLTLKAINNCSIDIMPVLRAERAGFYRRIALKFKTQKIFLQGWLKRAYELN